MRVDLKNNASDWTNQEQELFAKLQGWKAAKAVKDAFPKDCNLTAQEGENVDRVLVACMLGVFPFSQWRAMSAWQLLSEIKIDCPCWIDLLDDAIRTATMEEKERAFLEGAYSKVLDMMFVVHSGSQSVN